MTAQPHQHARVEALHAVADAVAIERVHGLVAELRHARPRGALGLHLHDERQRVRVAPAIRVEHGKRLIEGWDALVRAVQAKLAQVLQGALLDREGTSAHASRVGVVNDRELAVRGEVDVELHAKAQVAGAPERRERVFWDAEVAVVQAAVGKAVLADLAPARVHVRVVLARRHQGCGRDDAGTCDRGGPCERGGCFSHMDVPSGAGRMCGGGMGVLAGGTPGGRGPRHAPYHVPPLRRPRERRSGRRLCQNGPDGGGV